MELTEEELVIVFDSLRENYENRPLTHDEAVLFIKIRKQIIDKK